jgi:hypothetical protein
MEIYKGYGIAKIHNDRFIISLNGANINTITGSLSCAKHCIDSDYEDMTPVKVDDKVSEKQLNDKLAEAYQKGFNDGAEAAANEISSRL